MGGITKRFNDLASAIENLAIVSVDLRNRAERSQITIDDIELNLGNLQSSADRVLSNQQSGKL